MEDHLIEHLNYSEAIALMEQDAKNANYEYSAEKSAKLVDLYKNWKNSFGQSRVA